MLLPHVETGLQKNERVEDWHYPALLASGGFFGGAIPKNPAAFGLVKSSENWGVSVQLENWLPSWKTGSKMDPSYVDLDPLEPTVKPFPKCVTCNPIDSYKWRQFPYFDGMSGGGPRHFLLRLFEAPGSPRSRANYLPGNKYFCCDEILVI